MIEWFDIDGIGKSAARFDFAKLADLNGHYIRKSTPAEIKQRLADALPEMEGGPAFKAGLDKLGWDKLDRGAAGADGARQDAEGYSGRRGSSCWPQRPLKLDDKAAKVLDDAAPRNA